MRWGRAGPRAFFLGHSTSLVGLSEDSPAVPTGDGLDSEEEDKEAPRPKLSMPEDLESPEAMVS